MSLAKNQAYVKGLMEQVKRGVDGYTQAVILETITWLGVMTVQDSGNAAAQWQLSFGGSITPAYDRRGGSATIGSSFEKRRRPSEISSSDTLQSLSGDAVLAVELSLSVARAKAQLVKMHTDFVYEDMYLINPIPPSGEGYDAYEANAFLMINVQEARQFGPERGLAMAKKRPEVKNVTG